MPVHCRTDIAKEVRGADDADNFPVGHHVFFAINAGESRALPPITVEPGKLAF